MLRQHLSLKQQQKLSPQQIQLMKLLQVPTVELEQRIKDEIEENPALEEGLDVVEDEFDNEQLEEDLTDSRDDFDVSEYLDNEQSYTTQVNNSPDPEEETNIPISGGKTFQEKLITQISLRIKDPKKQTIALNIIGNLDESGYLRREILNISDDLAFMYNIMAEEQEIEDVLYEVQDLDPAGIGARDLKECLIIQLKRKETTKIRTLAINVLESAFDHFVKKHYKKEGKQTVLWMLQKLIEQPEFYKDDPALGIIVQVLTEEDEDEKQEIPLRSMDETPQYQIFGKKHIDSGAKTQLRTAMRLPIAKAGALMPDAHHGYGLPIGGVLATKNAVIPYGVGMDIGCRMCLSVFPLRASYLENNRYELKKKLQENTCFGKKSLDRPMDDAIFERSEFREIPMVRHLKNKARKQIGSSGSGNHFVDFGINFRLVFLYPF